MRKNLSKSDIRELNQKLSSFSFELNKKDMVEILDDNIIMIKKKPYFFYYNKKRIVPTLHFILQENPKFPKVTVDMGAVRFMAKGADLMRPGITDCDEFIEDDIVIIIDETHSKPLAVGLTLFDSKTIMEEDSGKVIKNIHYIGDFIWNSK